jgi:hypothetical protein
MFLSCPVQLIPKSEAEHQDLEFMELYLRESWVD